MSTRFRVFRWRAIGPLLLFLLLLGVAWLVFGDWLVEDTGEEVSTKALGTQVDLNGLRVRESESRLLLAGLAVADPFRLDHNLLETGAIELALDPAALLEKKLVIDRLSVSGLRFGTRRATPARPVEGGGFAPTLLKQVRDWSAQFDVPLLSLTPLDTIRSLVLDPSQLATVQSARAVVAGADSLRSDIAGRVSQLNLQAPVDSATALADRLADATPARLGVAGTREAIQSVRRTLAEVAAARKRLEGLEQSATEGVALLRGRVLAVDSARLGDYAFARSLLQLPSFAAPDVGAALFGPVSVDRFEQAVYWAELAQRYLPPGLRPQVRPAPSRLRMDGTTVAFPRARSYPAMLLRDAAIDVTFDAFGATHRVEARAAGITTQPAVYGRPAVATASGRIGGARPMTITASGRMDHTGPVRQDTASLRLDGVPLPGFTLPGLPFTLSPGAGNSRISFSLRGDQLAARWSLQANQASWSVDSARLASLGTVEQLVWRVLSGLDRLELEAELRGSLQSPSLTVRSNLDQAIADRVRAVLGEELQAAERRVRARVDSLVADGVREAQSRAEAARSEVTTRVETLRQQLDEARTRLEARLRALGGGLGGVLGL